MKNLKGFQLTREKLDYLHKRKQEDPGLNKYDACAELGTTPRTLNKWAEEGGWLDEVLALFPPNKMRKGTKKVAPRAMPVKSDIYFRAATMPWRRAA